eukprot:jgi/Botrbrau1/5646/Bobra.55_1s0034.1
MQFQGNGIPTPGVPTPGVPSNVLQPLVGNSQNLGGQTNGIISPWMHNPGMQDTALQKTGLPSSGMQYNGRQTPGVQPTRVQSPIMNNAGLQSNGVPFYGSQNHAMHARGVPTGPTDDEKAATPTSWPAGSKHVESLGRQMALDAVPPSASMASPTLSGSRPAKRKRGQARPGPRPGQVPLSSGSQPALNSPLSALMPAQQGAQCLQAGPRAQGLAAPLSLSEQTGAASDPRGLAVSQGVPLLPGSQQPVGTLFGPSGLSSRQAQPAVAQTCASASGQFSGTVAPQYVAAGLAYPQYPGHAVAPYYQGAMMMMQPTGPGPRGPTSTPAPSDRASQPGGLASQNMAHAQGQPIGNAQGARGGSAVNGHPGHAHPQHLGSPQGLDGHARHPGNPQARPLTSAQPQPQGPAQAQPLGTAQPQPLSNAQPQPLSAAQSQPPGTAQAQPLGTPQAQPLGTAQAQPLGTTMSKSVSAPDGQHMGRAEAQQLSQTHAHLMGQPQGPQMDSAQIQHMAHSYGPYTQRMGLTQAQPMDPAQMQHMAQPQGVHVQHIVQTHAHPLDPAQAQRMGYPHGAHPQHMWRAASPGMDHVAFQQLAHAQAHHPGHAQAQPLSAADAQRVAAAHIPHFGQPPSGHPGYAQVVGHPGQTQVRFSGHDPGQAYAHFYGPVQVEAQGPAEAHRPVGAQAQSLGTGVARHLPSTQAEAPGEGSTHPLATPGQGGTTHASAEVRVSSAHMPGPSPAQSFGTTQLHAQGFSQAHFTGPPHPLGPPLMPTPSPWPPHSFQGAPGSWVYPPHGHQEQRGPGPGPHMPESPRSQGAVGAGVGHNQWQTGSAPAPQMLGAPHPPGTGGSGHAQGLGAPAFIGMHPGQHMPAAVPGATGAWPAPAQGNPSALTHSGTSGGSSGQTPAGDTPRRRSSEFNGPSNCGQVDPHGIPDDAHGARRAAGGIQSCMSAESTGHSLQGGFAQQRMSGGFPHQPPSALPSGNPAGLGHLQGSCQGLAAPMSAGQPLARASAPPAPQGLSKTSSGGPVPPRTASSAGTVNDASGLASLLGPTWTNAGQWSGSSRPGSAGPPGHRTPMECGQVPGTPGPSGPAGGAWGAPAGPPGDPNPCRGVSLLCGALVSTRSRSLIRQCPQALVRSPMYCPICIWGIQATPSQGSRCRDKAILW